MVYPRKSRSPLRKRAVSGVHLSFLFFESYKTMNQNRMSLKFFIALFRAFIIAVVF